MISWLDKKAKQLMVTEKKKQEDNKHTENYIVFLTVSLGINIQNEY